MTTEIALQIEGAREPNFTATMMPADKNAALVYLATLSPANANARRSSLNLIARILTGDRYNVYTLPWDQVRYQHLIAVRAVLLQTCPPSTVQQTMNALKGTIRHAYLMGQVDSDTYMRIIALPPVRHGTLPPAEIGTQVTGGRSTSSWIRPWPAKVNPIDGTALAK